MKKPIALMLSIATVGVLSACTLGTSQTGSVVDDTVANTAMLRALGNMSNMTVGSLELSLDTVADVTRDYDVVNNDYEYDDQSFALSADGSVNVKVSDLWGTAPQAHVSATAALTVHEESSLNGGTPKVGIDLEIPEETVNAYYSDEFAYVDLSGAPTFKDLLTQGMENPESFPDKFKGEVGPISELGIPDMTDVENQLASSQINEMVDQMLPMLELMPNVTATQVGSELRIVYELTQEDLPDLIARGYLEFAKSMGASIPSSLDASMQAELDEIVAEIMDVIDLTLFRVEMRINTTRNIFSYLKVELDATVTIEDVEYTGYYDEGSSTWVDVELPYTEIVDINTATTIQLLKFSEAVTITLPTDLDTYTLMGEPAQIG